MIGNDIVDLCLANTQSNWQREGFLEKQFTTQEIEVVRAADNPFLLVWRFWSMKEAAYKVIVQQQEKRFFAPQKFACTILSESEGEVQFQNQKFSTKTTTTRNYIYTSIGESQFQWLGSSGSNVTIQEIIAKEMNVSHIEIRKNTLGIPQVFSEEQQVSKSFTKTHHGRFLAFEYQ